MSEKVPKAIHSGILEIASTEIPCYVLENKERILSTRGVMKSLGRSWRGPKRTGTQLPVFLEAKNLKPFVSEDLIAVLTPKKFKTDKGATSQGFSAEILPTICETYLNARDEGVLTPDQERIARNCDILIRGFARIGIVALIDAATGYEKVRAREDLEKILDEFISKELRKWAKTFPDEFYQEMFRLRGWQYPPFSVKRPSVVGRWTNDLVYERLAPGVLDELRRLTPKDPKGRRKHRYFQRLTKDIGHPRLREHLAAVIALMRASSTWDKFHRAMQRALPRYGDTLELPFEDSFEEEKAS